MPMVKLIGKMTSTLALAGIVPEQLMAAYGSVNRHTRTLERGLLSYQQNKDKSTL